jgi:TRAP-type C4-dicarboxylate transport system substrate-binding protein
MKPVFTALCRAARRRRLRRARDRIPLDRHPSRRLSDRRGGQVHGHGADKLTNGKDSIKVFNNSALGAEKDTIEQTKIGALAMTRVNIAPMNNICPTTVVPTMPFLFRSKEHMRAVLDGPIGEEILKSCEAQGFIGLAYYDSGSRSMYTVKKPIKTLPTPRAEGARAAERPLGRAARGDGRQRHADAFGEVYTALKTGLVDAPRTTTRRTRARATSRSRSSIPRPSTRWRPRCCCSRRRSGTASTPDEQKALRQAAKESVPYMRKLWDAREEQSLATVKAGGAQIIEVDKTAFQAAMKPVYDKFITDPKTRT